MRTIDKLSQMPANEFLTPANLITAFDGKDVEYWDQQYNKGLEVGLAATEVHISIRNVWSARMKNGGIMSSYETIGYHTSTAALMRGFIDSGVTIVVWRENPQDDGSYTVTDTVIQGERVK